MTTPEDIERALKWTGWSQQVYEEMKKIVARHDVGEKVFDELKDPTKLRNNCQSKIEQWAFAARLHGDGKYFAYWKEDKSDKHQPPIIATWMGDKLATVLHSSEYKIRGFGRSIRVAFRAIGVDGREYYGNYMKSSGDYVRMQLCKNKKSKGISSNLDNATENNSTAAPDSSTPVGEPIEVTSAEPSTLQPATTT